VTPLLVALGAAAGAPLRFLAGHWLDRDFPFGTLLVNVVGSFLLGWFSALSLGNHAVALLGTGFCGAFTTTYAVATVGLALAACGGGYLLGHA
jgi:CrcB protein